MVEAAAEGARFVDFLAAAPGVLQSEVLKVVEVLRSSGAVELRTDGRWWAAASPPG